MSKDKPPVCSRGAKWAPRNQRDVQFERTISPRVNTPGAAARTRKRISGATKTFMPLNRTDDLTSRRKTGKKTVRIGHLSDREVTGMGSMVETIRV